MKKITAVIPTLLKNTNVLTNLIISLVNDSSVEEIIIINNSTESFSFDNSKVRIITENKNLYVNPSWNLGVSEARCEYVTLVNDDIIIPPNFCSDVLDKIGENNGIIGIDGHFVNNIKVDDYKPTILPEDHNQITLSPVSYRTKNFGIMMFFNKKAYTPIPEGLEIFFGDDFLVHCAKKRKLQNAIVGGKEIIHINSLTSKDYENIVKKENIIYKKYVYPWYKRILYFYERDTHYVFNILFLQFAIRKTNEF